MYKNALNIGTLAGLTAFGIFLMLYYMGVTPFGIAKFLGTPIPIIAIIWAGLKTRDKGFGGNISFMQAFLVGLITTLIWCTCKGFCMYIFMTVFPQQVIDQYLSFLTEYVEMAKSMDQEEMAGMINLEEIKTQATPMFLMTADISNNLIFGSAVSFVVALIIKRNKMPKV